MKFASYDYEGDRSFGIFLRDDLLVDLPEAARTMAYPAAIGDTLDDALRSWDETLTLARVITGVPGSERKTVLERALRPIASVQLRSPVSHPSKIIGIGLNYADHCREQGIPPPKEPVLFAKLPSAIIGPGDIIRWSRNLSIRVDFEAELAVIVGRKVRGVSAGHAGQYVAGYTALNDITARDLQAADKQWVRSKSLDTFCPMGPVLVTPEEIGDPDNLPIRCTVNGTTYQDSNTREMIFPVFELLARITRGITLEPGDVVTTGTPHGVGVFRKPPVFLKGGDEVVVTIEGIGELRNTTEELQEN